MASPKSPPTRCPKTATQHERLRGAGIPPGGHDTPRIIATDCRSPQSLSQYSVRDRVPPPSAQASKDRGYMAQGRVRERRLHAPRRPLHARHRGEWRRGGGADEHPRDGRCTRAVAEGAPLGARAAPAAGAMSHPAASLSCGRAVRVRRDRRCVRVVGVCVCASCARSVHNTGGQAACVHVQ